MPHDVPLPRWVQIVGVLLVGLDKNFAGLLPVWDLVFGTFYMPRGASRIPATLAGQLAWPFRSAR